MNQLLKIVINNDRVIRTFNAVNRRRSYHVYLLAIALTGYTAIVFLKGYTRFSGKALNEEYHYSDFRQNAGDAVEWSGQDFSDEDWSTELFSLKGVYWIRAKIALEKPVKPYRKQSIKVWLRGAYDLYWDGQLIGRNGQVGHDKTSETAGLYQQLYIIPDSLATLGMHQIAMRVSNFHDFHMQYPRIMVGEYLKLSREPLILTLFIHLLAGFFMLAALYYYALFFVGPDRQKTFVILGSLCLFLFALTIMEYLKFYYQYPYSFQKIRLLIIGQLIFGTSLLLPLLFLHHFRRRRKFAVMLVVSISLLCVQYFVSVPDAQAYFMILIGITSSLAITLGAGAAGLPNVRTYAIGLLLCSTCFWFHFDLSLFLGFALLIAIFLYALAIERKVEKTRYEASLVKASRLEVELLKKQIQPHFLVNTLTSLINVVEDHPELAADFIYALSDLFDILNDVSSRTTIPVQQEVSLCRAYLQVMSYRKDTEYGLDTIDLNQREVLPPAVLLTILENGLTHNKALNGKMNFTIKYCQSEVGKTYTTVASGQMRKRKGKHHRGTGHQYIQARLKECYGNRWSFQSGLGLTGWETSFTILAAP